MELWKNLPTTKETNKPRGRVVIAHWRKSNNKCIIISKHFNSPSEDEVNSERMKRLLAWNLDVYFENGEAIKTPGLLFRKWTAFVLRPANDMVIKKEMSCLLVYQIFNLFNETFDAQMTFTFFILSIITVSKVLSSYPSFFICA